MTYKEDEMKYLNILLVSVLSIGVFFSLTACKTDDDTGITQNEDLEVIEGYLVDNNNRQEFEGRDDLTTVEVGNLTRTILLENSDVGYSVYTSEGEWYRLDDKGSRRAEAFITASIKENGIFVVIEGTSSGDYFVVEKMTPKY